MSWIEYVEMSLGLLALPKSEFLIMTPIEVFMRYEAHRGENLREEVFIRMICFYSVTAWADKIKKPEQLWQIKGVDDQQPRKVTNARLMTEEEKKLYGHD